MLKYFNFFFLSWVENKMVLDRLIETRPNIKIVKYWLSLNKFQRAYSKSFDAICSAVLDDTLMTAKLFFLVSSQAF